MRRASIGLWLGALMLCAATVAADPGFRVVYSDGIPRIELAGDWAGSRYRVVRAASAAGEYLGISSADALCTGECYAIDLTAEPGATYWYRFDLQLPDGSYKQFGPYVATISPELATRIAAQVSPEPLRTTATIRLTLAGARGASPMPTTLALYDLGGRRMSTLQRASLAPGTSTLRWDPRADDGTRLPAGRYLLSFRAADGRHSVSHVTIVR